MNATEPTPGRDDEGAIAVVVALVMVVMLGMAALVVDVGRTYVVRSELQNAADAAALGAVTYLPDAGEVTAQGVALALENHSELHAGAVQVTTGSWDEGSGSFTPAGGGQNAVQVTVKRTGATGNAVDLTIAPVLGRSTADVNATAVAVRGGGGTKFLIDDEAFDTDEPALEALASSMGRSTDYLLSDTDGDGYVQLSNEAVGVELELPTGQVGDEGLFDIDPGGCTFPFPGGGWSFEDFILHNIFTEILPDDELDPLVCVDRVDDPSAYPGFVDPASIQVSPLYKSDVSALNPVGGDPAVNAKGERRGLLAFSIVGVGDDPDGGGSQLPNLIFRIAAPQPVGSLGPGLGGSTRLVS